MRGNGVSPLKSCQAHTGHRHGLLCSLCSAQVACLCGVGPASASSLYGCGLPSAWRPSLHLSGAAWVWSSLGSPYSGEDERGLQRLWLGQEGEDEEACSLLFCRSL